MIVYCIKIEVQKLSESEWLGWMQKKHIPAVIAAGGFKSYEILKRIAPDEDKSHYQIRYYADSMEVYEKYKLKHSHYLQHEHNNLFGKVVSVTRDLFEVI